VRKTPASSGPSTCFHAVLTTTGSYVLLVATSSFFVNTVHSVVTSKHRKLSGLKYPIAYASNDLAEKDPKAYKFNCGTLLPLTRTIFQSWLISPPLISSPTRAQQLHREPDLLPRSSPH
jgi:hypothetical protein